MPVNVYQVPGFGYVAENDELDHQLPGLGYISETQATSAGDALPIIYSFQQAVARAANY